MRRSLAVLMLSLAAAGACGGSANRGGAASPATGQGGAVAAPAGASTARIDAIAAVIARTSNSTDGFVALRDSTDAVGGGPERIVQMSCDGTACHFEALCDKPPLTCDRVGPKLEALGLHLDPQNPGVYAVDRAGTATDFARLTETVYLSVFGASPSYRLVWRSNQQTTELPVQT